MGISSIFLFWNIFKIALPSFALNSYEYRFHKNDFEYQKCQNTPLYNLENNKISEDYKNITNLRQQSLETIIQVSKRESIRDLIKSFIVLLTALIIFIIHWCINKKNKVL